ncbi:cation:proton antiporter [Marinospirillum perlucidum]|uniref:cation:proton antiporter n=1 Tax=Marinospirillum perlucidum TaxID=1982602 RepID=UPI000DF48130|nr:cation:proton antiporter [Marinospirillum perlucidum]
MQAALPNWLPFTLDAGYLNILFLGIILSLSILADTLASRTALPRISLLVVLGLILAVIQQVFLGQEPGLLDSLAEPLIQVALVMVAFLLGSELTLSRLRVTGSLVLIISLVVILTSFVIVGLGLWLLGFSLLVAVSLAAISVATDPAAISESIREKKDHRLLAKVLLGIVAIDDGWGILVFGLSMALLGWVITNDGQVALLHAFWELGGALLLGLVIGLPGAWLTGRLRPGEPTQVEALALILLLAGLSSLLGVSALLASMVTGSLIANLSFHHKRSFREIEHIEWPFLVFFFVLSGASINLYQLTDALWLTLAYILLRTFSRLLGGWLALRWVPQKGRDLPKNLGLALTPQAGVAIGMALLAAERFPELHSLLLPVVVASTLFFELVGPLLIRRVLR